MNDLVRILTTALLWGAGGAGLAWLLSWPIRSRGWVGGYVSIALVATFATIAAVIGNTRAMLISDGDGKATIAAAVIAGILAAVAALVTARTFRRDSAFLHSDIAAIKLGVVPTSSTEPMSRELREVHHAMRDLAQNLTLARKREQALESSRRELIAWISHDLRTPLAGLRAMAEALQDGVVTDEARYHAQIGTEVTRLTGMVDDLFQLSRLHVGVGVRRQDRISLSDLVSDTVSSLEPVAHDEQIRLLGTTTGIADGTEVLGDASGLNRALTNLVHNAIQHTGKHGTVTIELSSSNAPGRACLRVSDGCGGVAAADVPRLFDVGFRGEQHRAPHPGLGAGGGLGLTITREIVDSHDGTIHFENTDDGCAFTIVLPLAS